MKLSTVLLAALIGAVTAFPTDPLSDVSIADRSVDLFTKRDCAHGWLCRNPGEKLCLCNQGKRVSALFLLLCVISYLYSLRSVHARGLTTSHQEEI